MKKIRSAGFIAEDVALDLVDTIMSIEIDILKKGQVFFEKNKVITVNYVKLKT